MDKKASDYEEDFEQEEMEEGFSSEATTRARNRTVMLTPDITDEVRNRLAREMESGSARSGFESAGSTYKPAGEMGAPSMGESAPPAPAMHTQRNIMTHEGEGVVWTVEAPIVGFLVSYDVDSNGTVFVLRAGRLIVSSEAAGSGNYLLINDSSVSPMHAIMRISGSGEIQVLDQLSEHGTKIVKFGSAEEETLSGDKGSLEHGDVICFGNRCFHVCVVTRTEMAGD